MLDSQHHSILLGWKVYIILYNIRNVIYYNLVIIMLLSLLLTLYYLLFFQLGHTDIVRLLISSGKVDENIAAEFEFELQTEDDNDEGHGGDDEECVNVQQLASSKQAQTGTNGCMNECLYE